MSMKLSETQLRAIRYIKEVTDYFGIDRWFIQQELPGAGYNTLCALESKGILKSVWVNDLLYWQVIEFPKDV